MGLGGIRELFEAGGVVMYPLLISSEKANMGLAVTVMDRVRKVPGTKLAIATQKP